MPNGRYPFSAQNGDAIPLDIVEPKSLTMWALTANTKLDITIPAGAEAAWFFATEHAVIRFGDTDIPNTLVSGTNYPDTSLIPAESPIFMEITAGNASLTSTEDCVVYMSVVEIYGVVRQATQISVG